MHPTPPAAAAAAARFLLRLTTSNKHASASVVRAGDGAVVAAASTAEKGGDVAGTPSSGVSSATVEVRVVWGGCAVLSAGATHAQRACLRSARPLASRDRRDTVRCGTTAHPHTHLQKSLMFVIYCERLQMACVSSAFFFWPAAGQGSPSTIMMAVIIRAHEEKNTHCFSFRRGV
jgi:hypothetical protein